MPLHLFVQTMLAAARAAGRPALSAGSPADARRLMASTRSALGAGDQVGPVRDLDIPTRAGHVPGRLYRAQRPERGLIVYLHGGGWLCGDLDDYDVLARRLVATSDCAVLQVDYRLAPEHPFPQGLEDAEDALMFAATRVSELVGRPVSIAVAGDSAGGNLATVIAATLRGRVTVCAQLLFYPVTDADMTRTSYAAHGTGLPLSARDVHWFFTHYAAESAWADGRISPLRRNDLADSPPTFIVAAEYDVLHDEAAAYAQALHEAGVTVQWRDAAGMTHGFARMVNLIDDAARVVDEAARTVGEWCHAAARR